ADEVVPPVPPAPGWLTVGPAEPVVPPVPPVPGRPALTFAVDDEPDPVAPIPATSATSSATTSAARTCTARGCSWRKRRHQRRSRTESAGEDTEAGIMTATSGDRPSARSGQRLFARPEVRLARD